MWPLSGDFGPVSLGEIEKIIKKAIDHGFAEFDVAPNYGNGFAEMALGQVLAGDRNVQIYTKFGNHPFGEKNFNFEALEESLEQSLIRLNRDSVKGIFLHNPRVEFDNYQKLPQLFSLLKESGHVAETGLSGAKGYDYSNYPWSSIDIYQQDFNLLHQSEILQKHKSIFFARSCLASGILSGKLTKNSVFHPQDHRSIWLKGDRLNSLVKRTEIIKKLTQGVHSLPSLARKYVMFNNDVDATILGISKPEHIDDIIQDQESGPLESELITLIKRQYDLDFGLDDEKHLSF